MLEKIEALPEELGEVENLLADSGYLAPPMRTLAKRPASNP